MKRGDVRWYTFRKPDKKRPVLVLTRDSILKYMREVTVAPITSTIREIPSEVFLSQDDGMFKDCAVNCDHIQTVAQSKVSSIITTLTEEKMELVRESVTFALDL